MRFRFGFVALLSSLALFGCGGSHEEAQAPEKDPWAGYTGKYTSGSPPEEAPAPRAEGKKSDSKPKAAPKEAHADSTASSTPKKRTTSKSTIQGESISLISPDELGSASKSVLKTKVVSSKVMVGAQYEEVNVQLKGAAVQIIRPAQSPNPSGPTVTSPKARNGALATTESGWYDEEADVLVVVNAGKKAGAQKALDSMLKH